ncbi:MAG: YiiX/YebB-like N1pC/P60 family cysteine hydrolase [Pseudobdellovibrionaceae bacterium]|jgi:hypothetical protein|nr:hypothetical protein [Pseudanabaena sp. M151S2SP2A07QC]
MKKLVLWFMQTRLFAWVLKHIIPFVRFTTYYTKMKGDKAMAMLELARPGDFVLTVDKKKLTGMLIPGVVDHAALVGFSDHAYEMTHEDFKVNHLLNVLFEADRALLMRLARIDHEYAEAMIDKCLSFRGAVYDAEFKLGVKALYCSELVYESDYERRIGADLSDLAGLGRPYISPEGLLTASNVHCVLDTDGYFTGKSGQEIIKQIN